MINDYLGNPLLRMVVRVAVTGGARKLLIVLAAVFATPALAGPVVFHVKAAMPMRSSRPCARPSSRSSNMPSMP
jgi:hypothetical protein